MRKTIPETRINKISSTIKELKRNRPLIGNETGKNLSLGMLYKPGTVALNNRLFKNHPSKFISKTKNNWYSRINRKVRDSSIAILEEYEESNSAENSEYSIWKTISR